MAELFVLRRKLRLGLRPATWHGELSGFGLANPDTNCRPLNAEVFGDLLRR